MYWACRGSQVLPQTAAEISCAGRRSHAEEYVHTEVYSPHENAGTCTCIYLQLVEHSSRSWSVVG